MKKYCPKCKEKRDFSIKSESSTETVYECSCCAFQYKDKTLAGWRLAASDFVGAAGFLLGSRQDHVDDAVLDADDTLPKVNVTQKMQEWKEVDEGNTVTVQICIKEEPLTAQNLVSVLTNFIKLYTICWLIRQQRFDDAIQYIDHGDKHFEEEANLLIRELKYNSPINIKFNIPEWIGKAIKEVIDAFLQANARKRSIDIEKELENKRLYLELNKEAYSFLDECKIDELKKEKLKTGLAYNAALLVSNPRVHITIVMPNSSMQQEPEVGILSGQLADHIIEYGATVKFSSSPPVEK